MSVLISAHQLRKAFAARPLFDGLTFALESGEKVGLIGPNGAGKSTLLRILAGQDKPDQGTLSLQRGLRVGYLEQVPTFKPKSTIMSAVLEGTPDPDDWESMARAQEFLSKLSLDATRFDPEMPIDKLSGGWKKRVALARELARVPDLLLLDEPTNHLDLESVLWLEDLLANARFATLTITHDRMFLQRVSNRILELDRRNPGGILSIQGDYAAYLESKQVLMDGQASREERMANKLRRETEWLRQGAKARTTKQQARIQRQGELAEEVSELQYRNQSRSVRLDFQGAEKNPKKLLEAEKISKSYGDRKIFEDVSLVVRPGSRLGILGPNGSGKSTLIRVLLGEERPDSGEVLRSEHLKVSYFQQNRDALDPKLSVAKTLCPKGDFVDFRGGRVHIRGYLDRFMFSHAQAEMAVGKLSGGEQSRILIAQLMLQEANVLVLDEPTNDLDIATLEVLESCLTDFPGAVLLVTHDRYFLDQVCDRIIAFDPMGESARLENFVGLTQWEAWRDQRSAEVAAKEARAAAAAKSQAAAASGKKRKLGFNDQRELDSMEATIHGLDARLAEAAAESARPEHAANAKKLGELSKQMADIQAEIDRLYARWAELEK